MPYFNGAKDKLKNTSAKKHQNDAILCINYILVTCFRTKFQFKSIISNPKLLKFSVKYSFVNTWNIGWEEEEATYISRKRGKNVTSRKSTVNENLQFSYHHYLLWTIDWRFCKYKFLNKLAKFERALHYILFFALWPCFFLIILIFSFSNNKIIRQILSV